MGIEPERVEMYNMSSAEGAKFAAAATEFTERIKGLGPNPVKREGVIVHAAARGARRRGHARRSWTSAATPAEEGPAQ